MLYKYMFLCNKVKWDDTSNFFIQLFDSSNGNLYDPTMYFWWPTKVSLLWLYWQTKAGVVGSTFICVSKYWQIYYWSGSSCSFCSEMVPQSLILMSKVIVYESSLVPSFCMTLDWRWLCYFWNNLAFLSYYRKDICSNYFISFMSWYL